MGRTLGVVMVLFLPLLLPSRAGAQTCTLSGSWQDNFSNAYNLLEDAGGNVTGDTYPTGNPASAAAVTGSHSGNALSFLSGGFNVTGTLTTCDSAALTVNGTIAVTLTRISTSYCGDGTTGAGEQCDDGNFANGDGCTAACTLPACGNHIVEAGEQCDDGNLVNGDGCSATCHVTACGNGIVEEGEQCDDGNFVNGDGCSATCQSNVCGDGTIESGEQCDDGNTASGDGCSATCQFEGCAVSGIWGDSFGNRSNLREDATGAITGDSYVPPSFANPSVVTGQRSGNQLSGTSGTFGFTGVMTSCDSFTVTVTALNVTFTSTRLSTSYCGDGVTDAGEACDDGNFVNGDGCTIACTLPACGNGILESGEQCDDGNLANGDGCSATCHITACGNGIVEEGEQCDDGNLVNGDGCSATCQSNVCGNGVVQSGEQCDDGNTTPGDGCDALCQFEGCNISGTWLDNFGDRGNFREDGSGNITGDTYTTDPSNFLPVTGTRSGGTIMSTAGPFTLTGTMVGCDTINFVVNGSISGTNTRISNSYCGDGNVDPGEQCDDGNFSNGDSCTVACVLPQCGNGVVDALEQCDDGNASNADACLTTCRPNVCGDGFVNAAVEQCDEGAADSNTPDAACRPDCTSRRCGDGVVDPGHGETCDDGNIVPGDGCDGSCLVERLASGTIPSGGGTITTDPTNVGTSPTAPVQTTITSPNSGSASVVVTSPTGPPQSGFQLVGKQIDITAPPASAGDPLHFTFVIDASQIPAGEDETTLQVFRNGVAVGDCVGSSVASPDPCVTGRALLGGAAVQLDVLTSHASAWTFAVPAPITTTTTTTTTTDTNATTTSTTLPGCGAAPENGCQPAGPAKAMIVVGNGKLTWKWGGAGPVVTQDFGSPQATTDYYLCAYAGGTRKIGVRVPAGATCGTHPCWKMLATRGFKYKSADGSPEGLTGLELKSGLAGKAKIVAKGKGSDLVLPTLPLTGQVIVQVKRGDTGACWDATYDSSLRNDVNQFKAKSD